MNGQCMYRFKSTMEEVLQQQGKMLLEREMDRVSH